MKCGILVFVKILQTMKIARISPIMMSAFRSPHSSRKNASHPQPNLRCDQLRECVRSYG
jgi:hypothetical protein